MPSIAPIRFNFPPSPCRAEIPRPSHVLQKDYDGSWANHTSLFLAPPQTDKKESGAVGRRRRIGRALISFRPVKEIYIPETRRVVSALKLSPSHRHDSLPTSTRLLKQAICCNEPIAAVFYLLHTSSTPTIKYRT